MSNTISTVSVAGSPRLISIQLPREQCISSPSEVVERSTPQHRFTETELRRALDAAKVACSDTTDLSMLSEKTETPTFSEKVTESVLSEKIEPIPSSITQEIEALDKQLQSVGRFITRLSSLLAEEDIARLEEPFGEFNTRFEGIKKALTRAQCLGNLKDLQLATDALDTLLSDLLALSTQLYETQAPDVQEMGFQIAMISIAWGVLSSSISAGMTWLLLPGVVSIITGVLIGSVLGHFKLVHMRQERIYRKDVEQWEQCRVPLQGIRAHIQRLNKHIQKIEGNTVADNIINRVSQRVNENVAIRMATMSAQLSDQLTGRVVKQGEELA